MTKSPVCVSRQGSCPWSICSGDRIRTCDLWVMSPASYRAAPPRVGKYNSTTPLTTPVHPPPLLDRQPQKRRPDPLARNPNPQRRSRGSPTHPNPDGAAEVANRDGAAEPPDGAAEEGFGATAQPSPNRGSRGRSPLARGSGGRPPDTKRKRLYLRFPQIQASSSCSGDRIRTCDLWVMSPASYRAAPPRVGKCNTTDSGRLHANRCARRAQAAVSGSGSARVAGPTARSLTC